MTTYLTPGGKLALQLIKLLKKRGSKNKVLESGTRRLRIFQG